MKQPNQPRLRLGPTALCKIEGEKNQSPCCWHNHITSSWLNCQHQKVNSQSCRSILRMFSRRSEGSMLRAGTTVQIFVCLLIAVYPVVASQASSSALNHQPLQDYHKPTQQNDLNKPQIQPRAGGLEPGDYVDEASEIEALENQPQIPTAQLMTAAGHVVPENFFLPGGSIPAAYYSRYQPQHSRLPVEHLQQVQEARQKIARATDLMVAAANNQASESVSPPAPHQSEAPQSLIDFNGYSLTTGPNEARESSQSNPIDLLADLLHPMNQLAIQQEQQHQQQQQQLAEQQLIAELQTIMSARQQLQQLQQQQQQQQQQQEHQNQQHQQNQHSNGQPFNYQQQQQHHLQQKHHQHQQHQQHQQHTLDNSAQSSENSVLETQYSGSIGPAYHISDMPEGSNYQKEPQKPYGLPTKSSNKKPRDMLEPLGNPKIVSSPAIDFVANQLPKTSGFEKVAEKIPHVHTPTVLSFQSSKDPMDKVKGINQKKRTVMRQAEHLAKMLIKSVNDKFGTNIGDQTDIPFLLSSLGPLGFAQNVLFDPSLLVTLLNSAEKTYFSDVLPGPAKSAIRPVLNIFRVPNKKRDKANILNVISYLTSIGQTPTSPKHRQGTGVEKVSKSKSRR